MIINLTYMKLYHIPTRRKEGLWCCQIGRKWNPKSLQHSLLLQQHDALKYNFRRALQWRRICHGVSNHQQLNLFVQQFVWFTPKKTSKLRVAGPLCENPSATGGFPSQGPVTLKQQSECHENLSRQGVMATLSFQTYKTKWIIQMWHFWKNSPD